MGSELDGVGPEIMHYFGEQPRSVRLLIHGAQQVGSDGVAMPAPAMRPESLR
jgi:hypothetical protein